MKVIVGAWLVMGTFLNEFDLKAVGKIAFKELEFALSHHTEKREQNDCIYQNFEWRILRELRTKVSEILFSL